MQFCLEILRPSYVKCHNSLQARRHCTNWMYEPTVFESLSKSNKLPFFAK